MTRYVAVTEFRCADCGRAAAVQPHYGSGQGPPLCGECYREMMRAWEMTFPNGFTPSYLRVGQTPEPEPEPDPEPERGAAA